MNKMNLTLGIVNSICVACGVTTIIMIAKAHKKSLKERNEKDTTNWTNVRDCLLVTVAGSSICVTTIKFACDAIHNFRHLK